jgi:chorismate synthase
MVTSFGESHGRCVGAVVDGCPAGLPIKEDEIQAELNRRKPQATAGGTARMEEDRIEVLSGLFNGLTTGAPICMLVWNKDTDSQAYDETRYKPRPGHADYVAAIKYGGYNDHRGGGRFSGRITAGYVMAGAVARKLLKTIGIDVLAHIVQIGGVKAKAKAFDEIIKNTDNNTVRCADTAAIKAMQEAIESAAKEGDSIGGVVEALAVNVPVGLGGPACDTLEGDLARALFAIPAVKGVEFGSGFSAAAMKGSEHNDPFEIRDNRIVTSTNNSGGISGGISNGMPIVARVAFKPAASIARSQQTVDLRNMLPAELAVRGRHDACIVPRAVPVVEAMMAVTLCDHALAAGLIPGVIR